MRNILIVFLFLFVIPLGAQQAFEGVQVDTSNVTIKKFDKKSIEAYKEQQEFRYQEIEFEHNPSWIERVFSWLIRNFKKLLEWIFGVEEASGIFSFILQALPYIIGLLVLFLILKFFIDRNTTDFISTTENRSFLRDSEDEELIRNADLNELLQKAISEKNYKNAIRFYYLLVLKKMDEERIIIWEHQKTNEDFIHEISANELKASFEENTRLYDFVWYGGFGLTHEEFLKAETDFKKTNVLILKTSE